MKNFMNSVAAAAVLATSATGTHAASLSTDVTVALPSVIALYCYDAVNVNVDGDTFSAAFVGADGGLGNVEVTGMDEDLGADAQTGVASADTSALLSLNNVCAFRALVTTGVDVSVTEAADPRLTHSDPLVLDAIDASGISLKSDASVTTGLGLTAPAQPISVNVPLDLANATVPGTYTKADLFTVTVTAQ